jgi:hypothetical protein
MAMYSYGAFVAGTGDESAEGIDYVRRQAFINTLSGVFVLAICFSFFYFIWMRSKLYQYAEELNAKSLTPADYCVMCVGCDFDEPGNADHIHNEVKDVMEGRFGLGNKVQYVNAAYRINDFYENLEQLH